MLKVNIKTKMSLSIDRQIDRQTKKQIDRQIDRWMDGQIKINRPNDDKKRIRGDGDQNADKDDPNQARILRSKQRNDRRIRT